MTEARTPREARLAVRDLERGVDAVRMSPASAVTGFSPAAFYLRRAQLALRQAERAFARADDPRLEPLRPLSPQLGERRPSLRPRRKRYRCDRCLSEELFDPSSLRYYEGLHPRCGGEWQPVPPLRRKNTDKKR